ncbi:phytanoyl-CoA dioxygenase family protein [Elongatibacter sediminis]|uniref:Phytanoyl-CoA dioxygenase family protein n=1 Tax=Elongatibacter sediminis TaxID=3119006 RepID=A0AAW9RAH1_9GAMM
MTLQARIRYGASADSDPTELEPLFDRAAHGFRVHGALQLDGCFDPARVAALREAFLHDYASRDRAEIEQSCLKVGHERFMFSLRLEPPFMDPELYANPRLLPVLHRLLGDDCVIQSFGAVCAYPGAPAQHVHRDHPPLFAEAGGLNAFFPPYALHVVVPLVDLTESTGTTALWEGSHRIRSSREENRYSRRQLDAFEGAVMPWPKVGDCYLMDFRLRHAGTANSSTIPRPILYLVYSRRWFQDRKNYELQEPLMIERDEYERIPEPYRHLFENARPSH